MKQLAYFTTCYINSCSEQSHKDSVRKSHWQLLRNNSSARQSIQLWEPSCTCLFRPLFVSASGHTHMFFVVIVFVCVLGGGGGRGGYAVYYKICNEIQMQHLLSSWTYGMYYYHVTYTTTKHNLFFQRWILTLLTTQLPNHCFQQDLRARFKKVSCCFVFGLTSW